jgi:hypothetical protein
MQGERNALTQKAFPALQRLFRERGVELLPVDLRWGVTETDMAVGVCLHEVNRCRPWFIGILGQRYGTQLTALQVTPALQEVFPVLREAADLSLTELEILHGVLSCPGQVPQALFFERDPAWLDTLSPAQRADFEEQSQEARSRLRDLKTRIRGLAPLRRYATPQDIATEVQTALEAALDARFPAAAAPDAFNLTHRLHAAYARDRLGALVDGKHHLERLDQWMGEPGAPPLLVTGASGCGKSALIAHWLQAWHARNPRDILFAHYLGASPDSADPQLLMRRLWEHLDRAIGETVAVPAGEVGLMDLAVGLARRLATAASSIEPTGLRIVIALDGLDKLSSEPNLRWLLQGAGPNVKLLASSLPGEAQETALGRGWGTLEITPLHEAGRRELICSTLRLWGRNLSSARLERILGGPLSGLPLFLKTVLDELRVSATDNELDERLDDYLGAADMPGLFTRVLARLEKECGELVRTALSLIWASRAGLEEAEIIGLTGATPLSWATLRNGLGDSLRDQGGRMAFGHDFLRSGVASRYLSTQEAQRDVHRALAGRFAARESDPRQAEELPYQLSHAQDWDGLKALLLDMDRFMLLRARGNSELLGHWLPLKAQGHDVEALLCDAFNRRAAEPEQWTAADAELAFEIAGFLRHAGAAGERLLHLDDRRTQACARLVGLNHPDTLTSMAEVARTLAARGDHEGAQQIRAHVLEARTRVLGADHPDTLTIMGALAITLVDRGDLPGARELEERALAARTRQLGPEHPDTLVALGNLARSLFDRGDLAGAQQLEERVLEARIRMLGPEHHDTLSSTGNLATTLHARGDLVHAQELEERILEARTRLLGPEHPVTLTNMSNLANTLSDLGQFERVQALDERVLDARRRLLGPAHPDTLVSMSNLARDLALRADHRGARDLQERVLAQHTRLFGPEHPATLTTMNNLATSLVNLDDLGGARSLQERVVETHTRLLGPEHPATLTSLGNLAAILFRSGDAGRALALEAQVLEAQTRLLGPEHPGTLITMSKLASGLADRGDLEQALKLGLRLLDGRTGQLGPAHPDTLDSMSLLARIHYLNGDLHEAQDLLERLRASKTRQFGPEHPTTITTTAFLALVLADRREYRRAQELQQRLVEANMRLLGLDHDDTLISMVHLARSLHRLDDLDGAQKLLEQVVEAGTRRTGQEESFLAAAAERLAAIKAERGSRT